MSDDESVEPDTGGNWGEWFFLGLLLPVAILGLVVAGSWANLVDAFDPERNAGRDRQLEVIASPLVAAGIAVVWVAVTFAWARDRPLAPRGRALLVGLAVLPGVVLALAGAAAALVASRG
ncbi:MAG TPA: hypothetical protein VD859_10635 [Nocardioides sp.]|nr:hypothetical protein [Nocardioides sp.]